MPSFLNRSLPQDGTGSILPRISLRPLLAGLQEGFVDRTSELLLTTESGDWLLKPAGAVGAQEDWVIMTMTPPGPGSPFSFTLAAAGD